MKKLFLSALIALPLVLCYTAHSETTKTHSQIHYVSSMSELNKLIADNDYVVVKFTASWCGPCKRYAPVIRSMNQEYKTVLFVEVDIDRNKAIANHFHVRSIPTTLFFKGGNQVSSRNGFISKSQLRGIITELAPSS